jgi:alpha-tubulin suppressor-like RCC1 family protein
VIAWGENYALQRSVPVLARSGIAAIAAGERHSMALRFDGSVVVWGSNDNGQTNVPSETAFGVTGIAAGGANCMANRTTGSAVIWGDDTASQWDLPATVLYSISKMALGRRFTAVLSETAAPAIKRPPEAWLGATGDSVHFTVAATGFPLRYQWMKDGMNIPSATGSALNLGPATETMVGSYSVTVSNDSGSATSTPVDLKLLNADDPLLSGSLIAWGYSSSSFDAIPTAAKSRIRDLSVGYDHVLALTAEGTVIAWGDNKFGQTNVPAAALTGVRRVCAGGQFSCAVKDDGGVLVWGSNVTGVTNVPVNAQSGVVAISAGPSHIVALKEDGTTVAWGSNGFGQTNIPGNARSAVKAVAAGSGFSLFLKNDGSVVAGGSIVSVPTDALADVAEVFAGNGAAAIKTDGTLVQWPTSPPLPATLTTGISSVAANSSYLALRDSSGRLSVLSHIDVRENVYPPEAVRDGTRLIAGNTSISAPLVGAILKPTLPQIVTQSVSVSATEGDSVILTAAASGNPKAYQWRKDGVPVPGATDRTLNLGLIQENQAGNYELVVSNDAGTAISAPPTRVDVSPAQGAVIGWGDGVLQMGPMPAEFKSGVRSISSVGYSVAALKSDGSVATWTSIFPYPIPDSVRSGVSSVSAGLEHFVALKKPTAVWWSGEETATAN